MLAKPPVTTPAERILAEYARKRQLAALRSAHGHECEALIDLVRAVDHAAFALTLAPNCADLIAHDTNRKLMIRGVAAALSPFLKKLRGRTGGIPWRPTTTVRSAWADQLLIDCGLLTVLRRLAAGEHYGLTETRFRGAGKLVITVNTDVAEASSRHSEASLRRFGYGAIDWTSTITTIIDKDEADRRLDRYVQPHYDWFIRYDSDEQLEDFYHGRAAIWSWVIAEGEALPDSAIVAGRRFEEWRDVNIEACRVAMQHIACAAGVLEPIQDRLPPWVPSLLRRP